jgi:uncharacterized RDD family membrane protein YckC
MEPNPPPPSGYPPPPSGFPPPPSGYPPPPSGYPPPPSGYPPGSWPQQPNWQQPGWQQPGWQQPHYEYAGWWSRVLATVIDGFIAIAFLIPGFVLFGIAFATGTDGLCTNTYGELYTCRQPKGLPLGLAFVLLAIGYVAYYVILCRKVGRTGQSWGRKAMGYKVVDGTTLGPIGSWKAFGRYLLSGIVDGLCYLGYLWPLWDARKQKFSDKILNTIAIKV